MTDPHVQDWTHQVIRKPVEKKTKQVVVSSVPTVAKVTYDDDGQQVHTLKIVSREMAQFIVNARVAKGWKQGDLAKNANLDVGTVGEIERGGGVYNPSHVNRLGKALGVSIPRK
jgi:ribosome-binding protein aMBF1 (putative translation factor)